MLLPLTEFLAQFHSGFNVFQYLTLRAILGVLTALIISLVVGPTMIRRLTRFQIGQTVRDDGPRTHMQKAGTPTMGGALILVAIAASTLFWSDLGNRFVWVVLIVTLLFGGIGWVDDYQKLIQGNPKGLSASAKIFWQSVIALVCAGFCSGAPRDRPRPSLSYRSSRRLPSISAGCTSSSPIWSSWAAATRSI